MKAVVCLPGGCEVTEVPDPRPAAGEVAGDAALVYGVGTIGLNVIMCLRLAGVDLTAARIPPGRYGTADEVASLVVWLLSDEASCLSGGDPPHRLRSTRDGHRRAATLIGDMPIWASWFSAPMTLCR